MKSFLFITKNLKQLWWLGLVGFLGSAFDIPYLKIFHLFFLFGLLGFVEVFANGGDVRIFLQSLKQIWGMFYTPLIYKFRLPSKETYTLKNNYILPFTGKWTVLNGGIVKPLSHSWAISPQRYAYDFIIVDDEGNYSAGDKNLLRSYYCYGKDIIAPADGEITKVSRHYKDSRVDGENVYCDAPDISGNCIIIKHSEHEYSMIAHLILICFRKHRNYPIPSCYRFNSIFIVHQMQKSFA